MSVVFCGCETWSLTLREKRRLRLFDSSVLRKIFESNRDELKKKWRKLHNVKVTQYFSGDKIEKNEMGGACSAYGEEEKSIQGFDGEI